MTELFIKIYRYFSRNRAVYWASMLTLFAVCAFFASQIHLEEDLNKLMPASHNEDGTTKLALADLKIKDKTFLLFHGKDGTEPERIAEVCDAFVDTLLAADNEADSASRSVGDIFYRLPDELMPDAIDYMIGHFPAYIDTAIYSRINSLLTPEHIARQMRQNRSDLQGEFGSMYPELIEMDPLGLRSLMMEQFKPMTQGTGGSYKIVDSHIFVADSTVCVAFVTPRYSATNTGQGSKLFETLNSKIADFAKSAPDVEISYHGTPASGYYNSSQIKRDLTTTIGGSLVVVLLFIMICYRKADTLPLLFVPILFGTLFGLAAMYFIKGQFSLLALGIGAVVLGVALSYALHVLTHYKYVGDPEAMLRDQVKPVVLSCLTTVGSFMGLIFVRTDLLRDFGLFATLAITGTTLFSLVFIPQLLKKGTAEKNQKLFGLVEKINGYPFHEKKPLLLGIMAVVIVCIYLIFKGGTLFDADIHNLGYKEESTTRSEQLLRSKTFTGDKQKYFASSGRTMEEAIERFGLLAEKLDSLQQAGLVKSYTHTNQIFVPLRLQQERIDAWKAYWTDQRVARARQLIGQYAPQAGLRAEAFDEFFAAIKADYKPDALYRAGIIPEGYLSTLMEQSLGGDYLCYTSVRCKNDTVHSKQSDYYRICDAIAPTKGLLVLDTYYYTTDTLIGMSQDFNVLQWVSMLFVFAVLLISFRFNIRLTLLGFMPILLSWLVVLGSMAAFGVKFNMINIIISTFIFGIGVDYSIFVMNGLVEGGSGNKLLDYHKTAIFFSALILVVTVSSMLLAGHPAIRSVGFPTLVGLLSAVVLSYVLQPAIYKRMRKKAK